LNCLRICYEFYGQKFEFSTLGIFRLSFLVGIIGGNYGIGGGAIVRAIVSKIVAG
jgi:hypothetical protein